MSQYPVTAIEAVFWEEYISVANGKLYITKRWEDPKNGVRFSRRLDLTLLDLEQRNVEINLTELLAKNSMVIASPL